MKIIRNYSKDAEELEVLAYSWGKYLVKEGKDVLFFTHNSVPQDLGNGVHVVTPKRGAMVVPPQMVAKVRDALYKESATREDQPLLENLMKRGGFNY